MWRIDDRSNSNPVHYRAKLEYDENFKVIGSRCNIPRLTKEEKEYYYNNFDPRKTINRQTGFYQVEVEEVEPLTKEINERINKMNGITEESFLEDIEAENESDNSQNDEINSEDNQVENINDESTQENKQNEDDNILNDESQNGDNTSEQTENKNQSDNDDETQNEDSPSSNIWSSKSFRKRGINKSKYHDENIMPRKKRQILNNTKSKNDKHVQFQDNLQLFDQTFLMKLI